MSSIGYVYTLNDPDTGNPKYVGATKNPEKRLHGHQHGATNEDVQSWIDNLSERGATPEMTLVRVAPLEELSDHETEMIQSLNEEWDLLNRELSSHYRPERQSGQAGSGTKHVRVPEPVYERAVEIQEERGFPSIGEAIRHMAQEGGHDV